MKTLNSYQDERDRLQLVDLENGVFSVRNNRKVIFTGDRINCIRQFHDFIRFKLFQGDLFQY